MFYRVLGLLNCCHHTPLFFLIHTHCHSLLTLQTSFDHDLNYSFHGLSIINNLFQPYFLCHPLCFMVPLSSICYFNINSSQTIKNVFYFIQKSVLKRFHDAKFRTWRVINVQWKKSEKDKYCTVTLICGIWTIKQTSEYNKKEADSQIWRRN